MQSTRIGARTLAIWIGVAAVVGLLVSGVLALLMPKPRASEAKAPPSATIVASAPTAKPSATPDTPSATDLPSIVDRATNGDAVAIETLSNRPPGERTTAETLAAAKGRSVLKQRRLAKLADALRSNLPVSADRESLGRLRAFADDRETATEALSVLASLRTPMAADMLYEIWSKTHNRTETTQLAEELLYSKEVRSATSEALAVVLDLRAANTCEKVKEILPRAEKVGDERSLVPLGRLNYRSGCGRGSAYDCYPCLRGTTAINDAIAAVRRRPAPGI